MAAKGRSRTPSTRSKKKAGPSIEYPKKPDALDRRRRPASFYQLKTMLAGRGRARHRAAIGSLSPYVAGKTGTTEDAVDGWFVGFTNDVTVAVWVGYDNGDGKRRSLGGNATGARVALPIFRPVIEAIWAQGIAPKAPLNGPSREAKLHLDRSANRVCERQDRVTNGRGFIEHFRLDATAVSRKRNISWFRARTPMAPAPARQAKATGRAQGDDSFFVPGRSYYPAQGWQPGPAQPPVPQPVLPQPLARAVCALVR